MKHGTNVQLQKNITNCCHEKIHAYLLHAEAYNESACATWQFQNGQNACRKLCTQTAFHPYVCACGCVGCLILWMFYNTNCIATVFRRDVLLANAVSGQMSTWISKGILNKCNDIQLNELVFDELSNTTLAWTVCHNPDKNETDHFDASAQHDDAAAPMTWTAFHNHYKHADKRCCEPSGVQTAYLTVWKCTFAQITLVQPFSMLSVNASMLF
jgi:hypothetical protein